ncbi:MAG: helix-turn-helix domain-containing protein [Oscillospiraceae bacterium]|jgi:transcriptional regulator with XRE-family HTH domain|nr:helix-turn-helix domain-containing protein [Oscillospiraceae bacterium]
MEIGNAIKKLRRERNLTQEELAEQLNVTGAAVSKWENGGGLPDITQLAPLVSVLGVSSDILLGIDNANDDEEVQKLIDETETAFKARVQRIEDDDASDYREHYEVYHNALSRFPNNSRLLRECIGRGTIYAYNISENGAIIAEIERMAKLVFDYGKNTDDILLVHSSLAFMYAYIQKPDFEKSKEHAKVLPDGSITTRNAVFAMIYQWSAEYEELAKQSTLNIKTLLFDLEMQFLQLGLAYSQRGNFEDAIEVYETLLGIFDTVCKDEVYIHMIMTAEVYNRLASNYLQLGDCEKSVDNIEKMIDHMIAQTAVFGTVSHSKYAVLREADKDLTGVAYDAKVDIALRFPLPIFEERLHDNPRYIALLERVGKLAG